MKMTRELSTTTVCRICRHLENYYTLFWKVLQFVLSLTCPRLSDKACFEVGKKRFSKTFDELLKIRIHILHISKN